MPLYQVLPPIHASLLHHRCHGLIAAHQAAQAGFVIASPIAASTNAEAFRGTETL